MLDRDEELRLLAFLATLAGLLGVVVSISGFEVGSAASAPLVRAYFSLILVIFMFVSALAYLGALQGKDFAQMNMAVLGYFSGLLGFVAGLAATAFFPQEYQFVGLWITGVPIATVFYFALRGWHKGLKWSSGTQ